VPRFGLGDCLARPARGLAEAQELLRASSRPDRPLGHVAEPPRDLDGFAGQRPRRGLEQDLVLRRSNLGLDDLDGEILLAATREPGGAVPDTEGALVGIHAREARW